MRATQADCSTNGCKINRCDTGFGDCDSNPFNGCESSVRSLSSCGSCGTACAIAHAVVSCGTGTCQFVRCQGGWRSHARERIRTPGPRAISTNSSFTYVQNVVMGSSGTSYTYLSGTDSQGNPVYTTEYGAGAGGRVVQH